ncbi:MAG: single-stranded-DNA-specific exonuclease RecJ [Sideroxydans sp.]
MSQIIARSYPHEIAHHLASCGIPQVLARVYAARGITDQTQLDTGLQRLLPPQQLKNSEIIASLLADAIAAGKRIMVIADYDADGATACAVAMRGLSAFGARVDFIVPNRFVYGYGLTPEIVRLAASSHPDILLTVDNGIASVEGVREAHRLGMQVLVTDHHLPAETLPEAECIVNPNQPGCSFPSKHLAGVGVMFYVLLALRAELRQRGAFAHDASPNLAKLLDLVALGTVADVVKLDDNNRILVQQGLLRIRAGDCCAGLRALLQIARKRPERTTAYELGFVLGPRLNAAGRLEDMSLGIRCLLTDDEDEAAALAAQLDDLNRERRAIEADMQDSALAALETVNPAARHALVLFDPTWHQGVIGILASRLKDRFHRPVIAFARAENGEIKGSGRSIPGFHLRDALDLVAKRHAGLILKFGGHAMAAGLTLTENGLEPFRAAFETVAREWLGAEALVHTLLTDGELGAQDFSLELAQAIQQQVWGQGFAEPLFESSFEVLEQRVVGEKHLKLRLTCNGMQLDAMHFFSTEPWPASARAVFSLDVNEYNGRQTLQLLVRHRT